MKRSLLMIPGPVETDGEVLAAAGRQPLGHTSQAFIEIFGRCLDNLRTVFAAEDGQPFVVAGSGTFAMELAVANVIEPGDRAVCLDTGYFAVRMGDVLRRHGAEVEMVSAEAGRVPEMKAVEAALSRGAKVLTITMVDTSTGTLAPVKELTALAHQYKALVLVDGVCAVAGQELRMKEWGVDLCLTGSQKALAVPPGLALVMARPAAMEMFAARKHPVASYYADWGLWLPVMKAYQERRPAYFGTPATSLVASLDEAVKQIVAEGMEARWARHAKISGMFKAGVEAMGIRQVPVSPDVQAVTLTTMYFPEGVDSSLIGRIGANGVIVAGGLASIAKTSFRVGHMGNNGVAEIMQTLVAIEAGLGIKDGRGVAAASAYWTK